ncbi:sensor histidine kinase [Aegicerativicinus sediminis]|uniref:sensor histidine kinase n=1 Tax=Aegicerativicinus sediminis TaxID=2893202 RepID=UPI001E5CAF80|nr:ATP-binding protein [Aegicerativicinus sediminis]
MHSQLEHILNWVQKSDSIASEEKELLIKAIKKVDSDLTISEFKLERTEKVKRTTAILLEETIEELDQKRKAIEESNNALKQSLEELKATQAQLIQSEKMASLGELTAGIAHEIQNPLNFVNNFSEVSKELLEEMKEELEEGNLDDVKEIAEDVIQNLEKINHHGKRADGIVKGMLQHSRTNKGEKEETDINTLVDEYVRLAYHGLRAKDKTFNASIETNFDDDIPKLNIIPQDVGRVILNILNNAFYATQDKYKSLHGIFVPTVKIKTKNEKGNITISIEDNGNGIPQNIIDKIFQPFFTTKPTGQGTGLGLSLCYDIIKAHGGQIEMITQEGMGTIFQIQLPKN